MDLARYVVDAVVLEGRTYRPALRSFEDMRGSEPSHCCHQIGLIQIGPAEGKHETLVVISDYTERSLTERKDRASYFAYPTPLVNAPCAEAFCGDAIRIDRVMEPT